MIIDKKNIFKNHDEDRHICLDLGCGSRKINPSYIGVDAIDYPDVDIVGDVFEVLKEFPNDSLDGVYSSHFMEHISDLNKLISELERVLKSGAELKIIVPHFSNPYFYSDPTHRVFFGLYSFCYFSECNLFSRVVPTYDRVSVFKLTQVRLRFKSPRPFYLRYGFKRVIEIFVNLSSYSQELYEDLFSGFISCYEVEYTLVKK